MILMHVFEMADFDNE